SENFCAFLDALANVRLHAFVLFLGDHWPDGGLGIGRIADGKHRHRVPYAALDFVETASRYKEACTRSAGLSAVQEGHHESGWNRRVESGVVEEDGGRLSAELQRHALHGRRAVTHDALADRDR